MGELDDIKQENEFLKELMSKINFECNQVIHKGYDSHEAIKTIKYMLCGSMG